MNQNISNFLLCGSAGWCMEIFWTGLHSLFTGQKTLTGKTSLLMFPIYGCAAVIAPLSVNYLPSHSFTVESCILPDSILWNSSVEAS